MGKCGLKISTPSPAFRNASQKSCSKFFAPGPATTCSPVTDSPYSRLTYSAAAVPEFHDAERRAVPAVAVADRLHTGLDGLRRGRERAVADLELDDVFAGGHQALGDGEHAEGAFDADR